MGKNSPLLHLELCFEIPENTCEEANDGETEEYTAELRPIHIEGRYKSD